MPVSTPEPRVIDPLYPSQVEDIAAVVREPMYALLNAPGSGKTRTVIEAAAELYRQGRIDTVFVVAPAQVRSVWADPDPILGEVAKWADTLDVPWRLSEFHSRQGTRALKPAPGALHYIITNPEYVRRKDHLKDAVRALTTRRTLLVIEESWFMRSPTSAQTKAMYALRAQCDRVVCLNGTPGEPADLFTMFHMFDPSILGVRSFYGFKFHFTQQGGWMGREIVGYSPEQRAEFASRTRRYAVARPEATWTKDRPTTSFIEARLTPETWKLYKDMEEDAVARLSDQTSIASSAGVVVMRLSQLTAGLLGGLITDVNEDPETHVVSHEKVSGMIEQMHAAPALKMAVFAKFRAEIESACTHLQKAFPHHRVVKLWGGLSRTERDEAIRLFAPGGDPTPAIVVAHPASGGAGINLAQASVTYFLTNDYSRLRRVQAEGRTFRPGQQHPTRFVDVLAVGPNGEKTIDHVIVRALRKQEKVEAWTADIWRQRIEDLHKEHTHGQ